MRSDIQWLSHTYRNASLLRTRRRWPLRSSSRAPLAPRRQEQADSNDDPLRCRAPGARDRAARRRGVSRSAWVAFTLSKALDDEEQGGVENEGRPSRAGTPTHPTPMPMRSGARGYGRRPLPARVRSDHAEGRGLVGVGEPALAHERRQIGPVIRSLQRVTDPLFRRVGLVLESRRRLAGKKKPRIFQG